MKKEKTFGDFLRLASTGLTDDQVVASSSMTAMLSNIAAFVTEKYGRRCSIVVETSGEKTANTDGSVIHVDVNNVFARDLPLLDRIKVLIGMLYHETGHILFTDFVLSDRNNTSLIVSGNLVTEPNGINKDVDNAYAHFLKLAENKVFRVPLCHMMHVVSNCVEDGAIENFLREKFPGYAGCLNFVRRKSFEQATPVDQIEHKEDAAMELILQEATSHQHKGKLETENFDLTGFSEKVLPLIQKAIYEKNSEKRILLVNAIFVLYIKEIIPDVPEVPDMPEMKFGADDGSKSKEHSDKGGGSEGPAIIMKGEGGDSSSGEGSFDKGESASDKGGHSGEEKSRKESLDDAMSTLKHACDTKHGGTTVAPSGLTESVDVDEDKKSGSSKRKMDASKMVTHEEDLEKDLEKIKKSAVDEMAEKLAEESLKEGLDAEAMEIPGERRKCVVLRAPLADSEEIRRFKDKEKELKKAITATSRMLAREIEDRRLGEVQHGRIYGKELDPSSIYRIKGGKMMTKKNPEDRPDMAVMCLIDESGSMSTGEKLPAAISSAFVVNGFCEELSIPLSIYGHTETFGSPYNVEMRSYKEFDFDGAGKTNARLLSISARENNRDGTAIRFCTKKLAERDEHIKLLMIISDGAPEAKGYMGITGIRDTRKAVAEARKKGITVVTAGIGSDKTRIKEVYVTDSMKPKDAAVYLNISDLNTLPKELVKIIKRNIQMVL